VVDWTVHARREDARYRDGEARLPEAEDQDSRQRQLTRMGNAAAGVGLARLMGGDTEEAREWFARAVERYRESYELAPPGSWGRPIAILKARILAGDWDGAESDAQWTLEQDAADAESPIGRYAATLALLVLGRDEEARVLADELRSHDDFPAPVGNALAYIAAQDPLGYIEAIEAVLESFETRADYLEDLPAADTVVVLQALAARRGMAAELSSPLLPRS
jgi:tetratricopeptide (TPR) repeat protein